MSTAGISAGRVEDALLARNTVFEAFFEREAARLAEASREMSARFLRGGRLLAFGSGPHATDAQHVSVEFVHPVIVGKRALPALDLSLHYHDWLAAIVQAEDMVMGFGPPSCDAAVHASLEAAGECGAMTFALPGTRGTYAIDPVSEDPFVHQECIEILYHTLWETVHVFFEHKEMGHDAGEAGFLYPFLGNTARDGTHLLADVAASIRMKVADDSTLRSQVARDDAEHIREATTAMHDRLAQGAKLLVFGNGGSATDANDFVLDCVSPPPGYRPQPALSLSSEPANVTAIANDVGIDVIFVRQMIALARPGDVAVAISTSGSSRNIVAALEEARKRKLLTIALLGYDGGEIVKRGLADIALVVRSDYIPRIQEVHASIYHLIRDGLERLDRGEH
jgi:D-sedoheptulose 7-phosphate isomerase